MAIKDQCENCQKRGTNDCTDIIVYDGVSCSSYSRGINLEKAEGASLNGENVVSSQTATEESSGDFVYTKEYLKKNTEIHGWLSFFLFVTVIGGALSMIFPIVTYNPAEYIESIFDVVLGVMLFGIAIYTLYAFIQRKPNAVFLGKTYVVSVFATNLIVLLVGEFEPSGLGSLSQTIRGLVWGVIWFSYLCLSKQVHEVIPKKYRILHNTDYLIVVALVVVPLAFIAWEIKGIATQESDAPVSIKESSLKEGECTDGRVVFSIPSGFTCKDSTITVEGRQLKFYGLEYEDAISVASITLCSDYDSDNSKKNFLNCWSNWEDEDCKGMVSELLIDDIRTVNGNDYYYRVKKYYIDETSVFWRFCLIYDAASSKVCLVSCYDNGNGDYLNDFLRSIRFD